LLGAHLYAHPGTDLAGTVIGQIRSRRPAAAQLLQTIADQPETKRFGAFDAHPAVRVARYLAAQEAAQPDAVPLLARYGLTHTTCGGYGDSAADADGYKRWYEDFARGIGDRRAVVFMEIDALITMQCLSRHGKQVRTDELRAAIGTLAALPHTVVYVDA